MKLNMTSNIKTIWRQINLNESCYNLEKQKEKSENLTYEHYMDEVAESRDTRKYEEIHSQESILKDIQKVFYD
jgi:hypothetical protein